MENDIEAKNVGEQVTSSHREERLVRHLWKCGYVKPSAKPVKVIELGDGKIKVAGSCRMQQPLDQPDESYHESYEDALRRFVANGERDLKRAEAELAGAKRRMASRKAMWTKHCESLPNDLAEARRNSALPPEKTSPPLPPATCSGAKMDAE